MSNQRLWQADPRIGRAGEHRCNERGGSKFCYGISTQRIREGRTAAGVGMLVEQGLRLKSSYQKQSKGYREGNIASQEARLGLSWTDLLDSIIHKSLEEAKDKSKTGREDSRLGLAEQRLWRGLMGSPTNYIHCNTAATCQKMLDLVGCIMYLIWQDDNSIIDKNHAAWSGCKELEEKMEEMRKEETLSVAEGWKVVQKGKKTCQMDGSFAACRMELLSLILSVANSIRTLCPTCPLSGLNNILNDNLPQGPGQDFYCQTSRSGYPFCNIDEHSKEGDLVIISRSELGAEKEETSIPLEQTPALKEETGDQDQEDQVTDSVSQEQGKISAPSNPKATNPNDRGVPGEVQEGKVQEGPDLEPPPQSNNSQVTIPEISEKHSQYPPGGFNASRDHPPGPKADAVINGNTVGQEQPVDHLPTLQQSEVKANFPAVDSSRDAISAGVGRVVGVVGAVGVMFLVSAYGLYRIYGKFGRNPPPRAGPGRFRVMYDILR
ncbi:hypothetical protein C922_05334 [Plasmodium inui San Antonio 1]|uniref:Uncharacterized protein n=1 Tax=Plasmodium inui San Antonio 1 TaxID=1237626 RepID=W7A5B0_9APIC|nr:hypothetical protein C922_05334 [Plasmodium inui San Antonio 1]EUD64289.1 hypothetical protein C922_05334 [Plasmodium inui San Antonio 1]